MADVKWIKITTDIFDDDKILLIESLPDADSIIVIWFKLLCLAGKQNNSGVFLLNDRIPYTDTMLATIFRRKEATVQLALKTFQEFGMIDIVDGVITIPNWGKHQNLDQLERKTEYMRNYMRDYRAKQKQLIEGSSEAVEKTEKSGNTNCKTNSKANVSSLDKNRLDKSRLEKNRERVTGVVGGEYPNSRDNTSQCDGCVTGSDENVTQGKSIELEKDKREKEENLLNIESEFEGDMLQAVRDWLDYKRERRQVYKSRGLNSLISQLKKAIAVSGEAAVIDMIQTSMANGYQGIIFDKIGKSNAGGRKPFKYDYKDEDSEVFPF